MKFIISNAMSFVCLLAMIAVGLVIYPSLPETVPMQPDINGTAGNYVPKVDGNPDNAGHVRRGYCSD